MDPDYPVLIDRQHRVAGLYGMVNVPTAVWIDESGRIVRQGETAFVDDRFKDFSGLRAAPYLDAVRDWIAKGDASVHALTGRELARRQVPLGERERLGHAHFQLGLHFHDAGERDAALEHFQRAQSLIPESWNFRRQAWRLHGEAAYGTSFREEVEKLNGRPYYLPPVLPADRAGAEGAEADDGSRPSA